MLLNIRQVAFLHDLHGAEHLHYGESLEARIKDDVLSIPELVDAWEAYEALLHHEDLIFRVSRTSVETREIEREDRRRDMTFREIRRILKFYSKLGDLVAKEAADALLFVMHSFDTADQRSLFDETAYLMAFLSHCDLPEHAAQVDAIPGLRALLATLSEANGRIDLLWTQRLNAMAELEVLGKRVDVRKDSDRAFIRLLMAINTVYDYNELTAKAPALRETLERVSLRIKGLNEKLHLTMAQRKGRRRKAAEAKKEARKEEKETQAAKA